MNLTEETANKETVDRVIIHLESCSLASCVSLRLS
jgi:hypothetical protein